MKTGFTMTDMRTQVRVTTALQGARWHAHNVLGPRPPAQQLCALRHQRKVSSINLMCSAESGSSPESRTAEEPEALPMPDTEAAPLPEPRDDDVLPDSLTDAILQASESTCTAIEAGCDRIVAEVLLGEFWDPGSGAVFAEEGDQQRFWKLTRKFAENLASISEGGKVRALYPDMGVSAMLKNQWTDASFSIGALSDRTPFHNEDEIIVLAAPDPQGLEAAKKITAAATEAGKTVVMFNPRLASGEVGVGLNVRRMMLDFLSSFTIAFSLRPVGDIGTVFRRYPGQWKVFIEDAALPGRFTLAAERNDRPAGEALDIIIQDALGGVEADSGEEPGFGQQVGRTLGSLRSFMNALTR